MAGAGNGEVIDKLSRQSFELDLVDATNETCGWAIKVKMDTAVYN